MIASSANVAYQAANRRSRAIASSANVAYQAANRPSRDTLQLVSNEAYVPSTNPRTEDQEYMYTYVDKNCLGSPDSRNEMTTSDNVIYERVS